MPVRRARVAQIQQEQRRRGARVSANLDAPILHPSPPRAEPVGTHDEHAALIVIVAVAEHVHHRDPATVGVPLHPRTQLDGTELPRVGHQLAAIASGGQCRMELRGVHRGVRGQQPGRTCSRRCTDSAAVHPPPAAPPSADLSHPASRRVGTGPLTGCQRQRSEALPKRSVRDYQHRCAITRDAAASIIPANRPANGRFEPPGHSPRIRHRRSARRPLTRGGPA